MNARPYTSSPFPPLSPPQIQSNLTQPNLTPPFLTEPTAPATFSTDSPKGDETLKPRKSGTFFISSGFDKNVNIFSADDWALAKTLSGHSGNVLGVDVTSDARWIASCGHDRTVKLWGCDDGGGL